MTLVAVSGECPRGPAPQKISLDQNAYLVFRVRWFAMSYLAEEDSCRRSPVNRGSDADTARPLNPNLGIHPPPDLDVSGAALAGRLRLRGGTAG